MTVKGHSPAFSGRFPLFTPLSSAVPGFTEVVSDVDDPSGLVVNLNLLPAVSATFVRSVDDDLVNQFVQHFRRQFFRVGVLADTFQKLPEVVGFLLTIVNQRLQFPNDLPYLLLLLLVLRGEFVKPLRAEPSRHHVLIDALEQDIQVLVPTLQRHNVQLGLFHRGLALEVGLLHLPFDKSRFKLLNIGQNALHVGQHDFFQRHRPDKVCGASPCVAAVVAAVEEVLIGREGVGGAVLQLRPAVGAEHLAGENADLPRSRRPVAVGTYLLHHLECVFVHDGRVGVPEQFAFLFGGLDPLLAAVVLGCGLEILRMAQILHLIQNPGYGFLCPLEGPLWKQFAPLLGLVCRGGEYLFPPQPVGDLCGAKAVTAQLVDVPNRFGGFLVNQPLILILFVLDVAERGICGEVPAALAFHFECGFDFLGGVPSVKFVTKIADGGHIKLSLYCRVHIIVDSDKPHIILHEHNVRIHPHLQIVPAQTGHILDNDRSHLASLDHLLHLAETRPVEVRSAPSVIHKKTQIFEAVLTSISLKQFLLVDNTVALALPPIVLGKTAVEGCDPVFLRLSAHGISFPTIGYGVLRNQYTISTSIIQRFKARLLGILVIFRSPQFATDLFQQKFITVRVKAAHHLMPLVLNRVQKVKEMRESSPDSGAQKLALTPTTFRETNNPISAIVIPCHSSENRRYIPMGFIDNSIVVTNAVLFIPEASVYHLGILTSNVHMAWMRAVCGRIKSDYRYSKEVVYNNFPWPAPTDVQKAKIEQTAQAILDARALYPDSSLADLYDELTMPPELRKAHQQNDRAVMQAYGFDVATTTETSCVAELMRMYQKLTEQN